MPLALHIADPDLPPDDRGPERLGADEGQGRAHDSALLDRIRAGDETAFEPLFREHYHGLAVYAARIVSSDAVAEEIVQDVLLRVWEQRERLAIAGSVAGYLYGAVRNQALAFLRHERVERRWREQPETQRQPHADAASFAADEATRAAELSAAIERAIAELPPRCRETYLLRRQHHLSYAEIARVMRVAPKTVEIQIGAALKALRASLADWLAP